MRPRKKIFIIAVVVVAVLSIIPVIETVKGYRCASDYADKGIALTCDVKLDGFGWSASASKAAIDGEIGVDRAA